MSIYQEIILDHYQRPRNQGKLKDPSQSVSLSNPFCGDKISMEIREKDGIIEEIAFVGSGCAISQASASLLTEYTKGKNKSDLRQLDKAFMIKLIGIELSPNRLKCALLSLEALHKLIK